MTKRLKRHTKVDCDCSECRYIDETNSKPTVDTMPPAPVTVTCSNCDGAGCAVCDGFGRVPGPPEMVMTESALPYVALVLYAAQQVEATQPEFARQLVEAARYFEGLMRPRGNSVLVPGPELKTLQDRVRMLEHQLELLEQHASRTLRDAADRREPRR